MKTELSEKIKNLDIEKLVKATFPFSKDFKIVYKRYFNNGIADWSTWFIVIYRGNILDDYILLTICEHSDFTRSKHLKSDFEKEEFNQELAKAHVSGTLFTFFNYNKIIEEEHFLQINEMNRLYKFLGEQDIILFEPTE